MELAVDKKKKRELTEHEALEIAIQDHPEWRLAWEKGELADEIIGEDGEPTSPHSHLHIHAVVERQLAADNPRGVRGIAHELQELGVSRHDVRHAIGAVLAEHMWHMVKKGHLFDEHRYMADLRAVVESHR